MNKKYHTWVVSGLLLIFEEDKYLSWQSNINYIFKASFPPALPLHTFRDRNNNIGISVIEKYSIYVHNATIPFCREREFVQRMKYESQQRLNCLGPLIMLYLWIWGHYILLYSQDVQDICHYIDTAVQYHISGDMERF